MSASQPIFACRDLRVWLEESPEHPLIVSELTLSLKPGECVALCGPSGAGKSTACLAAFGLTSKGMAVAGDALLGGQRAASWVGFRGTGGVAFVLQDPATNFSPHVKISTQLADLNINKCLPNELPWCEPLGLSTRSRWFDRFPSECSGGELQRLALVAALVQAPRLLVADEPTAALDPANRDAWCEVVRAEMERGLAVLLVTHDDAVLQALSARRLELGTVTPPPIAATGSLARGAPDAPRVLLEVRLGGVRETATQVVGPSETAANPHFIVHPRDCLALVGPSGAGKTSLLNLAIGMPSPLQGTVHWEGKLVAPWPDASRSATAGRMAVVLQQARQGLNPFRTVHDSVVAAFGRSGVTPGRCRELASTELEALRVPAWLWHCRPSRLSVGQAQRVAIAQALALRPALLVCDEPTSAQDAGHRALIVRRLLEMRETHGTAVLIATHDSAVVEALGAQVLALGSAHPPGEPDGTAIIPR